MNRIEEMIADIEEYIENCKPELTKQFLNLFLLNNNLIA